MQLSRQEEAALAGEEGYAIQLAYRVLLATGKATNADRLEPVSWAHLSGVNYNTIGDAGESFLAEISAKARVKIKTTVNPMGYDIDSVSKYDLGEKFVQKQESIRESYLRMGITPLFSCVPYDVLDMPASKTRVAFAESNAAIFANSVADLETNKESAFSALASAITGKSPYSESAVNQEPEITLRVKIKDPNEIAYGMLGYFAGKTGTSAPVALSCSNTPDRRQCKAICGGMGTSGTCSKFVLGQGGSESEKIDFGPEEMSTIKDELSTTEQGDIITLGSPQLGLEEISLLSAMLKGRSFKKRCMVFTPRIIRDKARRLGYTAGIEAAGAEILVDCCTCLTPLINKDEVDAVITNSIKGAYYLKNSTRVQVNLKSLSEIVKEVTV
ncbi:MAG: hypothetical protein K8823_251 [Cenarchaeum symbiont of Oopsacas minuta]|nr:hypothetical protein [Cenarchaeum symbiont of Oopsacas minuta]